MRSEPSFQPASGCPGCGQADLLSARSSEPCHACRDDRPQPAQCERCGGGLGVDPVYAPDMCGACFRFLCRGCVVGGCCGSQPANLASQAWQGLSAGMPCDMPSIAKPCYTHKRRPRSY